MRLRGIGLAGLLLAVSATGGCAEFDEDPQLVEIVAGGGEQAGGAAPDAAIRGRLVAMVMGTDGALSVLTEDKLRLSLWTVRNGQLTSVLVKGVEPGYISQAAAGPGGSVHVALWNGAGGVWQIGTDGKVVPKQSAGKDVHGVALDGSGRMYLAEDRADPVVHQLVQRMDAGRATTVLGRELAGVDEAKWSSPGTRSGFSDGTPGTGITVEGGLGLPLAVAPDGTVYAATSSESVIAVRAGGATRTVAGSVDDFSDYPETPFLDRGPATDAALHMRPNGGLVTDRSGNLYLVSDTFEWGYLPGTFDWTGAVSEPQRELLSESRDQRDSDTEVVRIAPDGSLATVAGHADAVAVDAAWIYLARAFRDEDQNERVVIVRTVNKS